MVRRQKFKKQNTGITRQSPDAMWGRIWESARLRLEERRKAEPVLTMAHQQSFGNRVKISRSSLCACFCCLKTFSSEAIRTWWDRPKESADTDAAETLGITAVCPYCGMDSVLGDQCGYELSNAFLKRMERFWFGEAVVAVYYSVRTGGWQMQRTPRES